MMNLKVMCFCSCGCCVISGTSFLFFFSVCFGVCAVWCMKRLSLMVVKVMVRVELIWVVGVCKSIKWGCFGFKVGLVSMAVN